MNQIIKGPVLKEYIIYLVGEMDSNQIKQKILVRNLHLYRE